MNPPASPGPASEPLPARMLNEFVYCPRLFYYEHVQGIFLHNADTKRGTNAHKRVDAGKGELPPPSSKAESPIPDTDNKSTSTEVASDPETIHARSVTLGSDSLGVIAKLDLVEITQDNSTTTIRPVEYKSGQPKETDNGKALWDSDRIQLGLQILLLRENGYPCEEGLIYYRQTKQRVPYKLTSEDEVWIRHNIASARQCITGPIPPPLDNSPKCPRCSLAPICLPDETQYLQLTTPDEEVANAPIQLSLPGFSDTNNETDLALLAESLSSEDLYSSQEATLPIRPTPIRRLITPDHETKVLYINTPGVSVSKKGENITVKDKGDTLTEIHIKDLHHVAIFGAANITSPLIQSLCQAEIPISHFTMGGWFCGLTHGHGLTNVFTRIHQFAHASNPEQALHLARLFVYGKIRNQRTFLMRNHVEPPPQALRALKHAATAALNAPNLHTLLGIEGAAALVYFRHFHGLIKDTDEPHSSSKSQPKHNEFNFDFKTRNRRPPSDPVNALLSLAYSLLARDCTIAALTVGFDPYVGLLHQPRFGRPALALDLMEEFRPIIADSAVITTINNHMITPADFVQAGQAVNLTSTGRKRFFQAYEKRLSDTITHPLFDYKVSYRRAIELQCRLLARNLTGEIDHYIPFTTR